MKLIIAGSRDITNYLALENAMKTSGFDKEVTEIVSGGATGADTLGERWAKEHKIRVKRFPANWDRDGKAAGPIRNKAMAVYVGESGCLLALWDGTSFGTKHMLGIAKGMGMRYKVYKPKNKRG